MEMQRRGAKQRQKAATALNYHSSRSHSVFTVSLTQRSAVFDHNVKLKAAWHQQIVIGLDLGFKLIYSCTVSVQKSLLTLPSCDIAQLHRQPLQQDLTQAMTPHQYIAGNNLANPVSITIYCQS